MLKMTDCSTSCQLVLFRQQPGAMSKTAATHATQCRSAELIIFVLFRFVEKLNSIETGK